MIRVVKMGLLLEQFVTFLMKSRLGVGVLVGIVGAGGALYLYFMWQAAETSLARSQADVAILQNNTAQLEQDWKDTQTQFDEYRKAKDQAEKENLAVIAEYKDSSARLMGQIERQQKRLKQYEKVVIEKPELYARAYKLFYDRRLRQREAAKCGQDCNAN